MRGGSHEQLAARVEQARVPPACGGGLLHDRDVQAVRPAPLDSRAIDPGQSFHRVLDGVEIRGEKTRVRIGSHRLLDLSRRDALEAAVHRDGAHRPVEGQQQAAEHREGQPDETRALAVLAPFDDELRPLPRRLLRLRAVLEPVAAQSQVEVHLRCLTKLDSRTRHTNSSKSMPAWRAAIGTRLWSVIPGVVLISIKKNLLLARSRMKSTRPQPWQSVTLNAASAAA